ncbi:Protein DEHYDRATION-INDUCED 19 homolog 3, partial [Striga hermonthica]
VCPICSMRVGVDM